MIKRCLVGISLLLPAMTEAETVRVLSGEHDGYTRLVLDLPQRMNFSSELDGSRLRLNFEDDDLSFDTGRVFARIRRERIHSFPDPGRAGSLEVELGCECEVSQFWHLDNYLVLDISGNGSEPKPGAQTVSRPFGLSAPAGASLSFGELSYGSTTPTVITTGRMETIEAPAEEPAPPAPAPNLQRSDSEYKGDLLTRLDDELARRGRVSEIEKQLLEQIGRAASQGLLAPVEAKRPDPVVKRKEEHTPTTPEMVKSHPAASAQIRAATSVDQSLAGVAEALSPLSASSSCVDAADFHVASWIDSEDFGAELAKNRAALIDEREEPDTDAALDYARMFIAFGFGAEAAQALEFANSEDPAVTVAADMARILEHGANARQDILPYQGKCGGARSLWSLFSPESDLPFGVVPREEIVQAYSDLPVAVKSAISPALTTRLGELGERELAETLLRFVKRQIDEPEPAMQLAEVKLRGFDGDDHGLDELKDIARANQPESPEAMTAYIEQAIEQDKEIAAEIVELIGVMLVENRGTPAEGPLSRSFVLALSHSARHAESIERLSALEAGPEVQRVHDKVYADLTREAATDSFLIHTLPMGRNERKNLSSGNANGIAKRLLSEGFASQALDFVGLPNPSDSDKRRLLRAEIYLAMEKSDMALLELFELSGEEAEVLRARAFSEGGQQDAAIPPESSVESLLVAQTDQPEQSARPSAPLADSRELLSNSMEVRERVDALIAGE
ncbi:hypothetical protein SAMN05421688_2588 [Poseidonocella pacifica]|uniref:Uncharacterized protein n=1 Tax=Poseidonocella pacifica TaxID=871651 RepID=A0A1I0XYE4_9RHOB|nr:hypothetical protein [Poseidonocella pacifica]SFB05330.1 hypothetical protein SAMN05421688_2588 [Poseidonocella pacifica]